MDSSSLCAGYPHLQRCADSVNLRPWKLLEPAIQDWFRASTTSTRYIKPLLPPPIQLKSGSEIICQSKLMQTASQHVDESKLRAGVVVFRGTCRNTKVVVKTPLSDCLFEREVRILDIILILVPLIEMVSSCMAGLAAWITWLSIATCSSLTMVPQENQVSSIKA